MRGWVCVCVLWAFSAFAFGEEEVHIAEIPASFTRNRDAAADLPTMKVKQEKWVYEAEATSPSAATCTTQSCCKSACQSAGYCCNTDLHTTSNQWLSCYEACSMRVGGDSKSYVENQCNQRGCSLNDPAIGNINKCGSCSDSTGVLNCVYGVTDSSACYYGSSLADNSPPPPPDNSPAVMEHPSSWYWGMDINSAQSTGGHSFYTGIWEMQDEGYPLRSLQFGMAGTWFTPSGFNWNVCGCNPNPTKGIGFGKDCCSYECTSLYETLEGGPGYWIGSLPSNAARWRPWGYMGCYNYQFGSPLFWYGRGGRPRSCDVLGFVQVSNRLLFPADGLTISQTGLLGVAWINTGMGKVNSTDPRNSWTLVVDSPNFQGPLGYTLPEMWKERDYGWEQQSANLDDFSNCPDSEQNGIAFEWNTYYSYHTDSTWRIPQQTIPVVNGAGALAASSWSYGISNTKPPIEQVLNTGHQNDANIMSSHTIEKCHSNKQNGEIYTNKTVSVNIGVLETVVENNDCVWQITPRNDSCTGWTGDCKFPAYFSTDNLLPIPKSKAPSQIQSAKFPEDTGTASYDGYNYKASGGCQTNPGPATSTIYCSRTSADTWIAWQWYKFVDQPALQRAHLTNAQKNYMQTRIENLHKSIASNGGKAQWIKTSQSVLKRKRATMDVKTLVNPPTSGMQYGHVPIVMYETNGSQPGFCNHVL